MCIIYNRRDNIIIVIYKLYNIMYSVQSLPRYLHDDGLFGNRFKTPRWQFNIVSELSCIIIYTYIEYYHLL